ncbi:hypothetical protein SCUP515_02654 [Seiridium cupressi]
MSPIHAYLPALKGIAIAGSLINGGTMTSGYRLLPAIYPTVQKSPQVAAQQWEYFYWSMSATVPLFDVTTFIAIGAVAYTEYQVNRAGLPWKIWATAAGIMPIGWIGMEPMKTSSQKTLDLLKEFNAQMSLRMMFPYLVAWLCSGNFEKNYAYIKNGIYAMEVGNRKMVKVENILNSVPLWLAWALIASNGVIT